METFRLVANAIEREHGDIVSAEYIDLADTANRERHKDILDAAKERYLRFPITMINGEFVFHGSLDFYSLSAAINKRLSDVDSGQ